MEAGRSAEQASQHSLVGSRPRPKTMAAVHPRVRPEREMQLLEEMIKKKERGTGRTRLQGLEQLWAFRRRHRQDKGVGQAQPETRGPQATVGGCQGFPRDAGGADLLVQWVVMSPPGSSGDSVRAGRQESAGLGPGRTSCSNSGIFPMFAARGEAGAEAGWRIVCFECSGFVGSRLALCLSSACVLGT